MILLKYYRLYNYVFTHIFAEALAGQIRRGGVYIIFNFDGEPAGLPGELSWCAVGCRTAPEALAPVNLAILRPFDTNLWLPKHLVFHGLDFVFIIIRPF